jgi:hypothetical protein
MWLPTDHRTIMGAMLQRCGWSGARSRAVQLADCVAVAAYVPNSGQKLERLDYRIDTWEPAMRYPRSRSNPGPAAWY